MAYQPHKPPTESHEAPTWEELYESILGSEEKSQQTHQQIIDLTIDSQPPQQPYQPPQPYQIVDLTRSDNDDDNDEKKQPQKTKHDMANKYKQVLEIDNEYRYKRIVSNLTKAIVGLYISPDFA